MSWSPILFAAESERYEQDSLARNSKEDHISIIQAMLEHESSRWYTIDKKKGFYLHLFKKQRQRAVKWTMEFAEMQEYEHQTVAIALNYLDRYLYEEFSQLDKKGFFELSAITALYIAAKLNEQIPIPITIAAELSSRTLYTVEEIEASEQKMLEALEWRMNPPSAQIFAHYFVEMLPYFILEEEDKKEFVRSIDAQLKMAPACENLVTVKPSVLAYSAMRNALKNMFKIYELSNEFLEFGLHKIEDIIKSDTFIEQSGLAETALSKYSIFQCPNSPSDEQQTNRSHSYLL